MKCSFATNYKLLNDWTLGEMALHTPSLITKGIIERENVYINNLVSLIKLPGIYCPICHVCTGLKNISVNKVYSQLFINIQ